MKKTILLALILSASLSFSRAEGGRKDCPDGPKHHGPKPERMLESMSEKLNLTDAQKEQIKPVVDASGAQLKAIWEDASLTPDQKRAKAREVHQALRGHVKGILTPEQKQQLASMKENQREKRAGRRHGGEQKDPKCECPAKPDADADQNQ